jgi:HAD superfamily hydrolase (TIGR01509 family)
MISQWFNKAGMGALFMLAALPSFFTNRGAVTVAPKNDQIAVIFDLGGVVFHPAKLKAMGALGLRKIFNYYRSNTVRNPQQKLYAIMNKITNTTGNSYGAGDSEGNQIPELMCDWFLGTKDSKTILTTILYAIEQHTEWFANKAEKEFIAQLARMMFTPQTFAQIMTPLQSSVDFIRECKAKGYKLYILSNWDAESFKLLCKKYPGLFEFFDGIVVSALVHKMKPQPDIFQLFPKNLNYIVVDDQKENIRAARACGMHGILCQKKAGQSKPNFKLVRQDLSKIESVIHNNKVASA